MLDNCNIKISNDSGNDIVGIWFKDNTLNIIFPKNYSFNTNNPYSDIQNLSLCFDKYQRKTNQKSVENSNLNVLSILGDKNFSFNSLFRIINNFIESGYYSQTIKTTKVNGKGNINFNKTINKFNPYLINDNLIYLDFIVNDNAVNYTDPLTEIHKFVVEKCFNIIGMFFPQIEIEVNCQLPFSEDYCINLLEKTVSETFNDDIRSFWLDILSCFKLLNTTNTEFIFYQTNNFEVIWESMLHELLCNVEISEFYFSSTWYLNTGNELKNRPSRPDIINIDQNNISIIDAKYYSYSEDNSLGTLPSTSDINKQILYKYNTKKIILSKLPNTKCNFYNLFLLPGTNESISYLGHAISEFDVNEIVHAFSVNIKDVIYKYVSTSSCSFFSKSILEFTYKICK